VAAGFKTQRVGRVIGRCGGEAMGWVGGEGAVVGRRGASGGRRRN
jgi:hypothetical protein